MRLPLLFGFGLLFGGVLAESPAKMGTKSTYFDAKKYTLLANKLLITPATNPELFSFTGRWLRSLAGHPDYPAYQATFWPGNSVTILFYGSQASIKIMPKSQGPVDRYSFVVSVDGGQDIRYDTPGFNTSEPQDEGCFIPIEIPQPKKDEEERAGVEQRDVQEEKVLEPHIVRVTSIAETPLSFEGLLVENVLINQGLPWIEAQSQRLNIEWIGEGVDADRPGGFFRHMPTTAKDLEPESDALFSSLQYQISEKLGTRHSHYSSGTCFSTCTDERELPGLATQYWQTSPLDYAFSPKDILDTLDPRHKSYRETPYRFPVFSTDPPVKVDPPSHVVVDVGVDDILTNPQVDPQRYLQDLTNFLFRLRHDAHPTAKILVIARDSHVSSSEQLHSLTSAAVTSVRDPKTVLVEVQTREGVHTGTAYLQALCPHLMPQYGGLVAKTRAILGDEDEQGWTKAERICFGVDEQIYRYESRTAGWGFLLFVVVGIMVWTSRTLIVGAASAVVGRKRLGLEEEGLEEGPRPEKLG